MGNNTDVEQNNSQGQFENISLRVFTVIGKPDAGKTTLIWAVYNKLMETGGELTYFHIVGADARDFHAIVVWEGKIIALCSIGDIADKKENEKEEDWDAWKYIKDGIEMARNHEVEILINALSLEGVLNEGGYKDKIISKYKNIKYDKEKKVSVEKFNIIEKQLQQRQIKLNEILKNLNE